MIAEHVVVRERIAEEVGTLEPARKGDVFVASLDHAVWFHRPFRADDWWLYDQVSPSASNGRSLVLARVFTQDGRLVATVAQEGLIRPVKPRRPASDGPASDGPASDS